MRLWSVHPRQLDDRGLVALWREGLLARAVLAGATRGYRHHPQLERFRAGGVPALDAYLHVVADEADARAFRFDRGKLGPRVPRAPEPVTRSQLEWEWTHLLAKLARRDPQRHARIAAEEPEPHPAFVVVPGPIEPWERGR